MTDDIRVAEILGYELGKMDSGESEFYTNLSDVCIAPGGRGWQAIPAFTTDPAADYKVLEWVRGQFSRGWYKHYREELQDILNHRTMHMHSSAAMAYKPGDYTRALLELDKKGLLSKKDGDAS